MMNSRPKSPQHAAALVHLLLGVAHDAQQPAHAGARLPALHGAATVQKHHRRLLAAALQAALKRVCEVPAADG
jgi:truncated hemoglobin YjbI